MNQINRIRNIFFALALLVFAPLLPFIAVIFFSIILIFLGSPFIAIILTLLFDSFLIPTGVPFWWYGTTYAVLLLPIYAYMRYSINI